MLVGATMFSGIGAPETAMPHWQWPWHAEIEKFPSAVLAVRHPDSINMGDVSAQDFASRATAIARPNVLIFGSPCQSYSIAGKRLGLDDPRGNLALAALGIVDRLKPDWFVFENVPGLFSSWSGEEEGPLQTGVEWDSEENSDFVAFLSAVDDIGYSGAWTVLDAQYRGVAQRRDRVFFVGHFRDWRASAAVLLEPESLCGNSPPSREAGKDVAPTLSARPTGGGGQGTDFDLGGGIVEVAMCLNAGDQGRQDYETETLIPINRGGFFDVAHSLLAKANDSHDESKQTYVTHALRGEGFDASEDGTGRGTPIVVHPIHSDATRSNSSALTPSEDAGGRVRLRDPGSGIGDAGDPMFTLAAHTQHAVAFDTTQITSKANSSQPKEGDPCHPLAAQGHPPAIAFDCKSSGQNGFGVGEIASTMRAMGHANTHQNGAGHQAVATDSAVRRLTPRECERLQGFPDDYTMIEYRGKPAADGPRYKALGNSMAVPVMKLILSRIEMYERDVRAKVKVA